MSRKRIIWLTIVEQTMARDVIAFKKLHWPVSLNTLKLFTTKKYLFLYEANGSYAILTNLDRNLS